MSFTNYMENAILNHVFGNTPYTTAATHYLGLCTGVTEAGVITGEPTGNNYSRVTIDNNTTNWPVTSTGSISNGVQLVFNEATGSWGTISVFFISDDPTAGNILLYGSLSVAIYIVLGDQVTFNTSNLTINLD